MAERKKTTTRKKPQYVRANKRKGAEPSTVMRRSFSIFLLVLFLGLVVFGIKEGLEWIGRKLFAENPRFEIQHLIISSDGKLTEDRIREYTGLHEGANLFALKFSDIENELSRVPVIESVYLERQLPNTLLVKVKERVPVAQINGRTTRRYPFVVDRYGFVLPPRQSASALPLIQGIDEELRLGTQAVDPDVEIVLRIISLCDSESVLRKYVSVESFDVKYDDFIYMYLKGGTRVRMPRHSLRKKLINLSSVIITGNARGQRYREIDMTLDTPSAPAVPY